MAHTDIMIDLETLATSPDAAILSIGAVKFDPFGDEKTTPSATKFYAKVSLDSCDELNLTVHDATIEWWASQSKEAQDEAFDPDGRLSIHDAFADLYKFCWGAQRVWSNGAGFDIVICETVFKRIHKAIPWQYWQVRDVRTIFDLGIDPKRPPITAHHALEDALNQAIGVQNVCNALKSAGINPFAKVK